MWTRPDMVLEIEYRGWTADKVVRHPHPRGSNTGRGSGCNELKKNTRRPSLAGGNTHAGRDVAAWNGGTMRLLVTGSRHLARVRPLLGSKGTLVPMPVAGNIREARSFGLPLWEEARNGRRQEQRDGSGSRQTRRRRWIY